MKPKKRLVTHRISIIIRRDQTDFWVFVGGAKKAPPSKVLPRPPLQPLAPKIMGPQGYGNKGAAGNNSLFVFTKLRLE